MKTLTLESWRISLLEMLWVNSIAERELKSTAVAVIYFVVLGCILTERNIRAILHSGPATELEDGG